MVEELIKVELTPYDAVLFVEFQKRYAFIKLMESIGAFDLKSGAVTIEFDRMGQIKDVKKYQHYQV